MRGPATVASTEAVVDESRDRDPISQSALAPALVRVSPMTSGRVAPLVRAAGCARGARSLGGCLPEGVQGAGVLPTGPRGRKGAAEARVLARRARPAVPCSLRRPRVLEGSPGLPSLCPQAIPPPPSRRRARQHANRSPGPSLPRLVYLRARRALE